MVDDHSLIRAGIASLLVPEPDLKCVGEASDGAEAIVRFRESKPDITLMDLQMPRMAGFEAITAIRDEFPEARIIVLTMHRGDALALRAIKAGAQAYLLKTHVDQELVDVIRTVHAGRKTMTPEIAGQIAEHVGEEGLTPKEIAVLRLIATGNSNDDIAAQLSITQDSVKKRVQNIFEKLGANDRTHAVTIGLKRGIFEL